MNAVLFDDASFTYFRRFTFQRSNIQNFLLGRSFLNGYHFDVVFFEHFLFAHMYLYIFDRVLIYIYLSVYTFLHKKLLYLDLFIKVFWPKVDKKLEIGRLYFCNERIFVWMNFEKNKNSKRFVLFNIFIRLRIKCIECLLCPRCINIHSFFFTWILNLFER